MYKSGHKSTGSKSRTRFIADQPLLEDSRGTQIDGLGFNRYASILADFALNTNGPFTIGINGSWGQGKTSLLRMIEQKLMNSTNKKNGIRPRDFLDSIEREPNQIIIPVRFNAWQFEGEVNPLIPLILTINSSLLHANKGDLDNRKLLKKLSQRLISVAAGAVASTEVKLQATEIIGGTFKPLEFVKGYRSHAKPSLEIIDLLEQRTSYYQAFELLNNLCAHLDGKVKIVVFIDDLDRCSPDKALQVLEAIKLVLWQPGFVFLLALDSEQLENYINALDNKKDETKGRRYFEKLLQVNFRIPQHDEDYASFLDQLLLQLQWNARDNSIRPLLGAPLDYNPRRTIRFVNAIQLIRQLLPEKTQFDIQVITVELLLSIRFESIYKMFCSGSIADNEIIRRSVAGWLPDEGNTITSKPDLNNKPAILADILETIRNDQIHLALLNSPPGRAWLNVAEDERRIIARLIRDQQTVLDFVEINPTSFKPADLDLQRIEDIENFDIKTFDHSQKFEDMNIAISDKMDALWDIAQRNMRKVVDLPIAERALLAIVKIDEHNAAAYNRLGILYAKGRNYEQSIECFRKAHKLEKSPSSLHNLGLIYYETEDFTKATRAFKEALKLEDGSAPRHIALAKTYEKQNKDKQMFYELLHAVELEPNRETYTLLHDAYLARGMTAEASEIEESINKLFKKRVKRSKKNRSKKI